MSDQVIDQIRAAYAQHQGFDFDDGDWIICTACGRDKLEGHDPACPWTYVGILLHALEDGEAALRTLMHNFAAS